jgi:hypothetical protein
MTWSFADPRWREGVEAALLSGELQRARSLVFHWLESFARDLPSHPSRAQLRQPELWTALADVVERTSDHYLIERFWQLLDRIEPAILHRHQSDPAPLPLLGIPILNRVDLLLRLLDSLDHPVEMLAIVDNSGGDASLRSELLQIQRRGHPLIASIRLAHNFANAGVASSWNQILLAFPTAPVSLIANNDIVFAPGVIASALKRINQAQPQFLGLLPDSAAFSAFLMTARLWDRLGLFEAAFHPAYCEDLDYRDRLRADTGIVVHDASFAHGPMSALNTDSSATLASDPRLAACNNISFPLNRLWYLSHRRLRQDPRGRWMRTWLADWQDD